MGLLITLIKRPWDEDVITHFSHFSAFQRWVNENICDAHSNTDVYLGKEDIKKLYRTLNKLDKGNCKDIFPNFFDEEYDEDYWEEVKDLHRQAKQILNNFDFKQHCVVFRAAW